MYQESFYGPGDEFHSEIRPPQKYARFVSLTGSNSLPEDTSSGDTVGYFTLRDWGDLSPSEYWGNVTLSIENIEELPFSLGETTGSGIELILNQDLDYESIDKLEINYMFEEMVSYNSTPYFGKYNIHITDSNESPFLLSISETTLDENTKVGSTIGSLSTSDPDAGDTHTYSLISGTGDTDNSAFTIDGDQLKIKSSPDYETKDSYSIRLQTTDSGGLTFEKSFTFAVNDIKPETIRSSSNRTLPDDVENLVLTGTGNLKGYGNSSNNRLTGNSGNNVLDGKGGIDVMTGKGGNDTYIVNHVSDRVIEKADGGTDTIRSSVNEILGGHVENLVLTGTENLKGYGNSGNNRLIGNSGNNVLDGRGGVDVMSGKGGNDTYIVNHTNDRVIEKADGGTDTIRSSVSETLSAHVENLVLTGSGNLKGYGNSGKNWLIGNEGNNVLDGKGGIDTLIGKEGNDTYIVDELKDRVIEKADGGTDTIKSSVNEILGGHVENLVLTGTENLKGYGNSSNNRLTGNAGNNVLDGKGGRDILTGKGGSDKFVYRSVDDSGVTNSTRDIITDFSPFIDQIDLSKIDAYTGADGNQTFVYIGLDPFSGTQGEVRFASSILSVNTGIDTKADMQIKLNGVTAFIGDFLIL